MSLSYETACRLVEHGEFGALRRIAEPHLGNVKSLEPRTLVMVAHALVYTGDSRRALSLLTTIDLESKAAHLNRSRARLVLGLANRSAGSMTIALSQFQKALHLAQESGTSDDVAWAHVYLFRHMIDSHPVDLAPAILPAVRAAVAKAGSPHIFGYLHLCVAVLEGHNGRLREAFRHCERVDSLLSLTPNPWLASGNQQNRAALLLAQSRFGEALKTLESLRETSTLHGLTHEAAKAEANIGRVLRLTGEYDRAIETLLAVVSAPSTSRFLAMYAFEEIAHSHLLKRDFERCDELLKHIESAAEQDAELATSYVLRWAALTRASLLLSTRKGEEAFDYLTHVQQRYRESTDAPVAMGLSILTAQALEQCGRRIDAVRQLCRADQLGATSIRETQGQFYDAAASMVADSDRGLASALAQRAINIRGRQGTARIRTRTEVRPSVAGGAGVAEVVNRLASVIDLAYDPDLAVREAQAIVESLGGISSLCNGSGHDSAGKTRDVEVLGLGTRDGQTLHLECELPSDPAKALVVNDVIRILRAAFSLERLKTEEHTRTAFWPLDKEVGEDGVLFLSPEMRELAEMAVRVAVTDVPVLITGETGTGKEVLARLIHERSPRAKKTFLPFNCTSVPREMMDSQLFGHRRGAFTGASDNFQGVIRSARNGTLLLDEIGDLGIELQPKLLRFLESGEILPLGESGPVHANVRVIAATNADLDAAVSGGRFREDLYYRLNIVQLRVPALRQRRIEIPTLAQHFLQKFAVQFKKGDLRLGDETMELLVLYDWPGNIRQLANEMRRLAVLAEFGAVLTPAALSPEMGRTRRDVREPLVVGSDQILVKLDQSMTKAVECVEKAMLQFALDRHDGSVEVVAKALGLSRKGLYLKRQRYGVSEASRREATV